jgi:hypothetical protein
MDSRKPRNFSSSRLPDRQAETLARIETALRMAGALELQDDNLGGIDPYNTHNGPYRRDVWGPRAR